VQTGFVLAKTLRRLAVALSLSIAVALLLTPTWTSGGWAVVRAPHCSAWREQRAQAS
jgi:uncharacterized membrane protein